ncbi:hypothetical protein DM01DRAFT_1336759 [Hesseltinella vesiculosa]|uniref:Cyclin-domain-containing protein n=1 Tax=Hesseltinella vesiculosa TaxID=101127 RepID=A0A1X2GF63_9FUNG|nr:hypothetical protein DM01DRAFT_1336759 [Hesseltinella vesiculosa]
MYPQQPQPQRYLDGPTTLYHQPPPRHFVPPEPLPSATEVQSVALTIPELAEFSSSMVHLMWHERHTPSSSGPQPGVSHPFKKYCRSILQATQLSESVVLLSLKYVAILLRNQPYLRGAEGSEYRLYTVALMLANKFLDDNTFTNKTWSDISGMKVFELNLMELEFLQVLKFALFIRKREFDDWKSVLYTFRAKSYGARPTPQLVEFTLKNMGLVAHYPTPQPQPQHDWHYQQQQQQQQQQAARQQQQQQAAAAAAAAAAQQQQQYNQNLYLSKAQQPHIPAQPLNRPLTRVPLRIPVRPVYQTMQSATSHPSSAAVYDSSMTANTATVIQPAPLHQQPALVPPTQQVYGNPLASSSNTNIAASSAPRRNDPAYPTAAYPPPAHIVTQAMPQQPPVRMVTPTTTSRPYDYVHDAAPSFYNDPVSAVATSSAYPLPQQQHHIMPQSMPTSAHAIPPPIVTSIVTQPPPNLRTTSLPSAGLDVPVPAPHYYSGPSQQTSHIVPTDAHNITPAAHYPPTNGYPPPPASTYAANPRLGNPTPSSSPYYDDYGYPSRTTPTSGRTTSNPNYNAYNTPAPSVTPQAVAPQKKTSGPVPEDPLTAADSYRVRK